ncbi:MAG TPA: di-heme oxidoredictase family protein, partial [Flavobacteriales bacterium]|nr:di-heme oxidoredictase family protein [Flavobacteriales bacterium]
GYMPETIPAGAAHANFLPPPNTGLGFIDALTDADILANADPTDADGDGISGRANYVTAPWYFNPQPYHIMVNGKYIGRFGRKGAAVDLTNQTVNAYNQDMGITSEFAMQEPYINGVLSPYGDAAPDPEVASSELLNVVFYLRTLKAPVQRNKTDQDVINGKQIFLSTGCGKCHTESFTTGDCDIAALANKTIYPYSDFLLHDMGPGLDDGYTEGNALTSEWKTPPLWGLGLSKNSQGGSYFLLHDGRAHSIEEAITMHGGEATAVISTYNALSADAKAKLLKFLESL